MMFRVWAGLLPLLFFSVGCRSDNEQYDLMQRDLRLQEDRIYQLEGYIEQYQSMLDGHESEPELIGETQADPLPASETPSIRRQPDKKGATDNDMIDSLAPPNIDLGEPDALVPPLRRPGTKDLLPADPIPALPDFSGTRSPTWGRRRLSDRPLFKSAVRPLERLRDRASILPIWRPNRLRQDTTPVGPSNVAPSWEGDGESPAADARTAEAPPRPNALETDGTDAPTPSTNDEPKQAGRPAWNPQR